ncbi:TPA: hypothetical protein PTV43_000085 [Clostridium botulinum]|uniref:gp53-like domain-containing protein n=1 Tax=Clostridium botulinum TaxID=1491 RepID=UPI0004A9FCA6|nr:hypothetical protein [Clostridium botulinum]
MFIIAYVKTNWIDGFTALNADNLNKMEQGISNNGIQVDDVKGQLESYVLKSSFSQTLTTKGYTMLPNGFLLQWGETGVVQDKGTLNITFSTPFPNAVFHIVATNLGSGAGNYGTLTISNRSKTGFTIGRYNGAANSGACSYLAVGW